MNHYLLDKCNQNLLSYPETKSDLCSALDRAVNSSNNWSLVGKKPLTNLLTTQSFVSHSVMCLSLEQVYNILSFSHQHKSFTWASCPPSYNKKPNVCKSTLKYITILFMNQSFNHCRVK
mgnify:FL=1